MLNTSGNTGCEELGVGSSRRDMSGLEIALACLGNVTHRNDVAFAPPILCFRFVSTRRPAGTGLRRWLVLAKTMRQFPKFRHWPFTAVAAVAAVAPVVAVAAVAQVSPLALPPPQAIRLSFEQPGNKLNAQWRE